jgi:phosphomannomutase
MTRTYASHAFKAYDIRGRVPEVIDADFAYALGLAFAQLAREHGQTTVAVGRDGRLSGPMLAQALMQGLLAGGVDVMDVGMVTTPMLYFAAHTVCASGVQVTGSHNPKDDNGFKMVLAGQAIYGPTIERLRALMHQSPAPAAQPGRVRCLSLDQPYAQRVRQGLSLARPMRVVVDCGSGVAGASAPAILRAFGAEVVALYSEVDGHFPHHHPDPSKPENLADLVRAVAQHGAELGLAFDGDGDRLGVVTADGRMVFPDRQLMLFAQDVLRRHPGAPIVFDVKCTQQLAPFIRQAGGVPDMYKTGHSLIKAHMAQNGAPLGGEMSGHVFFKDGWFGFDDATHAALRLLGILSQHANATAVFDALPNSVSTPELNVACAEGESHAVVQRLVQQATFEAPAQVCTIDGLRVDWPDGFGLIRASNTTPVLVLRFEGQTEAALQRIRHTLWQALCAVKPDATLADALH